MEEEGAGNTLKAKVLWLFATVIAVSAAFVLELDSEQTNMAKDALAAVVAGLAILLGFGRSAYAAAMKQFGGE